MGIQRIESVTYTVADLPSCVRFFTDVGLTPRHADERSASFSTLAGQTLDLRVDGYAEDLPPTLEDGSTIREVVWGIDSADELNRLVAAAGSDREVRRDDDGVHHTVDETGFGVGLALATEPDPETPETSEAPEAVGAGDAGRLAPANRWGSVGRWNEPVTSALPVRPLRMCQIALNIPKEGRERAVAFYVDRLGFVPTDVVEPMGVFMRAPGDADQHNLLLCHRPDAAGVNHVAYEVPGFDHVVEGGNHLLDQGWTETRRLGRHTIGSNGSEFGLAAAIYTNRLDAAERFADEVDCGQIAVNTATSGWDVHMPFGGFRRSGSAFKEQGEEAVAFYTRVKTVAFHIPPARGEGR